VSRRLKQLWFVVGSGLAVALVILAISFIRPDQEVVELLDLDEVNAHIDAGGVLLEMPVEDVVRLLGEGEYVEGFGGYGHDYDDLCLLVSFNYNDVVIKLDICNDQYAIYGVQVGDTIDSASDKLLAAGFELLNQKENIFKNKQVYMSLHGKSEVEQISVWLLNPEDEDVEY